MSYQNIFAMKMIRITVWSLRGSLATKNVGLEGECEVFNGSYCALGKHHVSGDPVVYHALISIQSMVDLVNGHLGQASLQHV
jgi:hypothetical protein